MNSTTFPFTEYPAFCRTPFTFTFTDAGNGVLNLSVSNAIFGGPPVERQSNTVVGRFDPAAGGLQPGAKSFGSTEFQLRDLVHRFGAKALQTAAEQRKKGGTRVPA